LARSFEVPQDDVGGVQRETRANIFDAVTRFLAFGAEVTVVADFAEGYAVIQGVAAVWHVVAVDNVVGVYFGFIRRRVAAENAAVAIAAEDGSAEISPALAFGKAHEAIYVAEWAV